MKYVAKVNLSNQPYIHCNMNTIHTGTPTWHPRPTHVRYFVSTASCFSAWHSRSAETCGRLYIYCVHISVHVKGAIRSQLN